MRTHVPRMVRSRTVQRQVPCRMLDAAMGGHTARNLVSRSRRAWRTLESPPGFLLRTPFHIMSVRLKAIRASTGYISRPRQSYARCVGMSQRVRFNLRRFRFIAHRWHRVDVGQKKGTECLFSKPASLKNVGFVPSIPHPNVISASLPHNRLRHRSIRVSVDFILPLEY